MEEKKQNIGLWVIFLKIAPKLMPLFTKLLKAAPKLFKSGAAIKVAGGAASVGLYTFIWSWQMAVSIVIFILVHEYGHLRAMKQCGIKTKGIYLVPGFGGAAVAEESFKTARNETYIAIMGPVFSLILIIPTFLMYFITENPMFAAIASIMALINVFNLLPINPLDGGRIMKGILYSFHGSIGFAFYFVSFFAAMLLSWYLGLGLLLFIAGIGLMECINDYGLKGKLEKFKLTNLRIVGFLIIMWLMPAYLDGEIVISVIISIIIGVILTAYIFDIFLSTKENGPLIIAYPWNMLKDLAQAVHEFTSLKPGDLEREEFFPPMDTKTTIFYIFAFIITIFAMVALVVFTSNIPGCELAREMLT